MLKGSKVVPNPDFKLSVMMEGADVIAGRVKRDCPHGEIFFTIPVVPKVKNNNSLLIRSQSAMIGQGQRDLRQMLRARGYRAFDLALNYVTSERRTSLNRRYLPDGVHPSGPGVVRMFRDLGRVVIGLGLLPKFARSRGLTMTEFVEAGSPPTLAPPPRPLAQVNPGAGSSRGVEERLVVRKNDEVSDEEEARLLELYKE